MAGSAFTTINSPGDMPQSEPERGQLYPQSFTSQAVGQPGLSITPGHGVVGRPDAKGSLPNKGNIFPNGDVEIPGADGSDVVFTAGPGLTATVTDLDPDCYVGGDGITGSLSTPPAPGY